MGVQLGKTGGLAVNRTGGNKATSEKSKRNQEFVLCLALIVLMAWAFLFSIHVFEWSSISHAIKSLREAIW
jgi:hypothetical protein